MKHCIFTFFLFITLHLSAQTPNAINYQAVARDGSGQLIINKDIRVRLSILSGNINGTNVYSETHQVKTNLSGVFHFEIGRGSVISGDFVNIAWQSGSHFAKIEIDPNGGNNFLLVGTTQFLSVPYALFAEDIAMQYSISAGNNFIVGVNSEVADSVIMFLSIHHHVGTPEDLILDITGLNNNILPGISLPYLISKDTFNNTSSIRIDNTITIRSSTPPGNYPLIITATNPRGKTKSQKINIEVLGCKIFFNESTLSGEYYGNFAGILADTLTAMDPISGDGRVTMTFLGIISEATIIDNKNFRGTINRRTSNLLSATNLNGTYRGTVDCEGNILLTIENLDGEGTGHLGSFFPMNNISITYKK